MPTTKFPTIAVATVAGFSLAAMVAPGLSEAQVWSPAQQRKARVCHDTQLIYEQSVADAVQIDGNTDGQNKSDADAAASDADANKARADAQKAGCSWAA